MKRIVYMVLACFLMASLNAVVADALIFDIGTKQQGSDVMLYSYSSGAKIYCPPAFEDEVHKIFDGNVTTGMDFISPDTYVVFTLAFPCPVNVSTILVKPTFNGSTGTYGLSVGLGAIGGNVAGYTTIEKAYNINYTIESLSITILQSTDGRFHFNDLLINYTLYPRNISEVMQVFNVLNSNVNNMYSQIQNINNRINSFETEIYNLNGSYFYINQTLQEILGDINNLWNVYNDLNQSINNIINNIENINNSLIEDITIIQENIQIIETDIDNIYQSITNLTSDVNIIPGNDQTSDINDISEIQIQINQTISDINDLNENLTKIRNSLPLDNDEIVLDDRVFLLESKNANLKKEMENLTLENENYIMKMENLTSDVEDLASEINVIEKDDKSKDSSPFGMGIAELSILIILVLIILVLIILFVIKRVVKKQINELKNSTEQKEESIINSSSTNLGNAEGQKGNLNYSNTRGLNTGNQSMVPVDNNNFLKTNQNLQLLPAPAIIVGAQQQNMNGEVLKGKFLQHVQSDNPEIMNEDIKSLLDSKHRQGEISEDVFTYIQEDLRNIE